MTNYESIKNMSIEDMAKMNVKAFMYMNGYRSNVEYHTTNQSIFDTREEAEEYELKWLQSNEDRETLDTITFKNSWNDDLGRKYYETCKINQKNLWSIFIFANGKFN